MEGKEQEHKHKNRLKGLFSSKEKKISPEADVDESLRSPSDKLYFQAPTPRATSSHEVDDFLHGPLDRLTFAKAAFTSTTQTPPLTRIDTSSARRWPSAAEIRSTSKPRSRSISPKQSRKGLVVRFADELPEVIGEGGDEADLPTISLRQRAHSHPPGQPRSREPPPRPQADSSLPPYAPGTAEEPRSTESFSPGLLWRTATELESISNIQNGPAQQAPPPSQEILETGSTHNGYLRTESHDRTSFAARVQAEMRAGEGMALLQAASNPSKHYDEGSLMDESPATSAASPKFPAEFPQQNNAEVNTEEVDTRSKAVNEPPMNLELQDYSTIKVSSQPGTPSINTTQSRYIPPPSPSNTQQLSSAPSIRTQLSAGSRPPSQGKPETHSASTNDSTVPISRTSTLNFHGATFTVGDDALQEFSTRVAHLFNIFLLSAESKTPISKCSLEDLVRAALWWFIKGRLQLESTIRDRLATPDAKQTNFLIRQQAYADLAKSFWITEMITPQYPEVSNQLRDQHSIDILETRKSIMSSLRKLTMSMKRNDFLPPEEATLPQGLDTSIWVQDDGNRSLLASQKQAVLPNLNDYFPLGDTNRSFHYGRAFAGAVLIEDADSHAQEYRSPVLISIIRGHNQTALSAVVASQDGMLKFCVQADKSLGPTWDNVAWNPKSNILDIRLPRTFLLRVQCSYQDFRTLRGIYDYQKKTHGGLVRQQGEELVFETFLKAFQYLDPEPASALPKEVLSNCRLRLFEKVHVEKVASGARGMHRGFRIGLVSSPNTKNLRGINQDLPPTLPIQFGFLRGDGGLPALLLRIHSERSKYAVVLTFEDVNERTELHARFTGISLTDTEVIVMDSGVKEFSVASLSQSAKEKGVLKSLEWQSVRVINEEQDDPQSSKTILSTSLRVVTDFIGGSITDRVNIEPGELKIRLDVNNSNELKVLRQPQQDMTVSVSESQVPKTLPTDLKELLATIATSQTSRTYEFPSHQELHLFQAALTGFSVLFDGKAASFNISRRRMVVPIYKKLDAAATRVQLVQREKVVQLLAFFENFNHGECMNFALKSTDVFETTGRHARQTLRIVDAKFAMPKAREAGAEAPFVCLDMPEYPGEHDDITILFDNDSDYENFTKALPAPVKAASRMPSVRR